MSNKNNVIDFQEGVKRLEEISNVPPGKTKKGSVSKKPEKIVAFPGSKIASIQKALDADQKFKTILGGRVISTLLGMFVLTIAAQSLWFSAQDTKGEERGLASTISRSLASMEAYLSGSKRGVASVAKRPSRLDDFNFGTLRGRYTMQTEGAFINSLSSNGQFIKIASAARFLKKHRSLWQLKFTTLRLTRANQGSRVYTLLDETQQVMGKAIIGVDGQGNLQSLQFKKTQL